MDKKSLKDAVKTAFLEGIQEFSFDGVNYVRKGKTFTGIKGTSPIKGLAEDINKNKVHQDRESNIAKIFISRTKSEVEKERFVLKDLEAANRIIKKEAKKGGIDVGKNLEMVFQWNNGEQYSMKYQVTHMDQYREKALEWKLQKELEFRSGKYRPLYYNNTKWEIHLKKITENIKMQCDKMLSFYEGTKVTDMEAIQNKCIDNIKDAEKTKSKMLVNQYRKMFCLLGKKNLSLEEIDKTVSAELLREKKTTPEGLKSLLQKNSPNNQKTDYAARITKEICTSLENTKGMKR